MSLPVCKADRPVIQERIKKGEDAALAAPKSNRHSTNKLSAVTTGGGGVKAMNPNGRGESAGDGR